MHNYLEDPVPDDPIQRVHAFARDLAYGVSAALCSAEIGVDRIGGGQTEWRDTEGGQYLSFLDEKWRDHFPYPSLLIAFEYFAPVPNPGGSTELYRLTSKAFALLEQPAPASIFISYRRSDSSALALLLLARFKMRGQEPFLDMNIAPGDDWEDRIRSEVMTRENFICLLGPTTLESEYVRQEIAWAQQAKARIIPIWHNGFSDGQLAAFQTRFPALGDFYNKQAIRIEQENALAYEGAIIQLLNRFGMMA
jgi:hypothetical protein